MLYAIFLAVRLFGEPHGANPYAWVEPSFPVELGVNRVDHWQIEQRDKQDIIVELVG